MGSSPISSFSLQRTESMSSMSLRQGRSVTTLHPGHRWFLISLLFLSRISFAGLPEATANFRKAVVAPEYSVQTSPICQLLRRNRSPEAGIAPLGI